MNHALPLSTFDMAVAALLVLLSAGTSLVLQLGVHRQLLWAAGRMVVQLLLVGLVLRLVFQAASPWVTVLIVMVMIAAAAREVGARPVERLAPWPMFRMGAAVVGAASVATVSVALLTAIRPTPWYDARYAIPLMGIVLGSVLNSASIGLDSFFGGLVSGRAAIEAQLALGATTREAFSALSTTAIRRGLIPLVNQMSAAGIITLPGVMTGQLIAGMDPIEAAKYQILLLFLLTAAGAAAAAGAVHLAARAVTDDRQRLRLDRLRGRQA